MRKLVVALLTLCLLTLLAVPASAARPVRESGTYQGLWAWSEQCTEGTTRTSCTDTYLDVWESPYSGNVWVCLWLHSYTIQRDRYRSTGSEDGCSIAEAGVFSAKTDGTASLLPTAVEVGTWNCGANTCRLTNARTVTVSADLIGEGVSTRSSGRGTDTWENCTYRYSYSSVGGQGSGTITLDGVTSDAFGFAEHATYKTTESCR